MSNVYDFTSTLMNGQDQPLDAYRGQVLLIVNTASECGFTPQFEGLEKLHQDYHERGLTVLGYPCNQFGGQDPGSNEEILTFCETNYGVSFPMFAKIEVNGADADPLFKHLKKSAKGALGTEGIKWNFTKFLVDREGQVVKRYASATKPGQIAADIEALL